MKVSLQQLLIAALAGGFIQEALARALPNTAALSRIDSTIVDKSATIDIAVINKRRANDDNGDDGDSSLSLFERNIIARGGGSGGHDEGHPTGNSGGHDGTTGGSTGGGAADAGSQTGTVGGLSSGDMPTGGLSSGDMPTGGLSSGDMPTGGLASGEGATAGRTSGQGHEQPAGSSHEQPAGPAAVCKRDNCKGYDSAGYPNQPKAFSKNDQKTLDKLTSQATPLDKNSADAYTARYQKERNSFVKYRSDPAQEALDEAELIKNFHKNYDIVKQERKTLSTSEIKAATDLGIKDPGKLQTYDIFSKTNGKRDANRMAEILVSDDGSTIVSSYTFARFDGNLNKLDNKGNPVPDGKDGYKQQDAAYIKEHRQSNSNVNFVFLHEITKGDQKKAQGITWWNREHIINKGTVAQVFRSHKAMGWGTDIRGKFTYKGDSKNPQESKEFMALMGTENLSPVGFMYADHAEFFGGRYPQEIYTFPFDETNIWTKIGPVDGAKLPRA